MEQGSGLAECRALVPSTPGTLTVIYEGDELVQMSNRDLNRKSQTQTSSEPK